VRQALLTVLLAAVALAAGGCGGGKSAATTTVTTVSTVTNVGGASVTTHGRFHYPPTLIDNFMRSCTKGDTAKQAYCGCALDKLSNNVSTRDFTRIGLSGGKVPPRIRRLIRQATRACRTGRS
jgi:hypothetical protein